MITRTVALVALLLGADGGPAPLESYRSRAQLPEAARAIVPKDFDFQRFMLAGRLVSGVVPVISDPPAPVRPAGDDLWIVEELPRRCPQCSGINRPEDPRLELEHGPRVLPRSFLWKVPRARRSVFHVIQADLRPCPPCLAP